MRSVVVGDHQPDIRRQGEGETIRPGRSEDVPALVAFGITFVEKMPGPARKADWPSCEAYLSRFIASDQGILFVAERGERLTGFICGMIAPDPFTGKTVALKSSWIVDPQAPGDGLALLRRFEHWTAEMGAERRILSHMHGDEAIARLLLRRGYIPTETKYERLT